MSPLPGGSRNGPVVGEDGLLTKHELLYCVYLLYFHFYCTAIDITCSAVCLPVCTLVSHAKMDEPTKMPFGGGATRVGPINHVLDGRCILALPSEYHGMICVAVVMHKLSEQLLQQIVLWGPAKHKAPTKTSQAEREL